MATAIPMQMAFASINAIPKAWWGCYKTTRNSRYILIISSEGTSANFIGYLPAYGDIAASTPTEIYFRSLTLEYRENISITFSKYSEYNPATKRYEAKDGKAVFIGNCNSKNTDILVLTGDKGYADEDSVDRYKMFA